MKFPSLKSIIPSGTKGGNSNLLFLVGAGSLVALGYWWFTHRGADAQANFANSVNSVYPYSEGDYGNSQNSFYPIQSGQPSDSYIHPIMLSGKRGFPDYTRLSNTLPTPFVEINFPREAFASGAKLANTIDKCAEVFDYGGRRFQ